MLGHEARSPMVADGVGRSKGAQNDCWKIGLLSSAKDDSTLREVCQTCEARSRVQVTSKSNPKNPRDELREPIKHANTPALV